MPFGLNFGYGIQRLVDANTTWTRSGHPTWLRLRNFPDVQEQKWAQHGFSISPSGTLAVGTTDILIVPQPPASAVSVHNIGQSMGKLRFGATYFLVSATFVDAQKKARKLDDEELVWREPAVVGLYHENKLFSIEDVIGQQAAGKTVTWLLTCNANALK